MEMAGEPTDSLERVESALIGTEWNHMSPLYSPANYHIWALHHIVQEAARPVLNASLSPHITSLHHGQ